MSISQSRFPTLWKFFQYLIGGTVEKRKLCILKYTGQKRILEIGCSLGNIAEIFKKFPNIEYTGIDIDPVVIEYARKSFADYQNFHFLCEDVMELAKAGHSFDYLLFAGVLHHVDDETVKDMLSAAIMMASDDGKIVVVDPLLPEEMDSWLVRQFIKLEQGRYVRNEQEMRTILQGSPGLKLIKAEVHYITGPPFPFPNCAKFGLYELKRK